jgi:hypothetical protein
MNKSPVTARFAAALASLLLLLTSHASCAPAATPAPPASPARAQVRLLVQHSPLAGFNYHEARAHWSAFSQGDALALVREPDNPHDANAVAVYWRGHKLGYVPRVQNSALAWAMDRGEPVGARISALRAEPNPRKRVQVEIYVE